MKIENRKLKILFMGTPEISATVLLGLIKNGYKPHSVVTRPDKAAGRSALLQKSPVKILAETHNISTFQPKNKLELEDYVKKEKPDLIIVAAYGMIITKETLDVPRLSAINVHPSLLPKYRGPWPIGAPILSGDAETGTTIMLMSEGMDEGDILAQKVLSIQGEATPELTEKLAELSTGLLIETLPKWIAGNIKPIPQDDSAATYTKMSKKEDGQIDWNELTALQIERMSRALLPWPGIYTHLNSKKLDLFDITVCEGPSLAPGQTGVVDGKLQIGTKEGLASPASVKLEGKSKIATSDFLRGHADLANAKLG